MRYRKTIKINKGVSLNVSKSGASLTVGGRGSSINFGKNGTYLNSGIPGTGIYNRSKISGKRSVKSSSSLYDCDDYYDDDDDDYDDDNIYTDLEVEIKIDDFGKITFYDGYGDEITDTYTIRKIKATQNFKDEREKKMSEKFSQIASETDQFINIYMLSPKVMTKQEFDMSIEKLKPKKYRKSRFSEPEPNKDSIYEELLVEAKEKVKTWMFWKRNKLQAKYANDLIDKKFGDLYTQWQEKKLQFDTEQKEIAKQCNAEYKIQFEEDKKHFELLNAGDKSTIEKHIDDWLSKIELPIDFSIQYELSDNLMYVDLDLPEIEDIPTEKATMLANGTVKRKNKTQKEIKIDYVKCVFGTAVFFAANFFNASPVIKKIVMSGYTQRKDKKTDIINDDYIYSIVFLRSFFEETSLSDVNPYEFCMEFENKSNVTSTMLCKTIIPYAINDFT